MANPLRIGLVGKGANTEPATFLGSEPFPTLTSWPCATADPNRPPPPLASSASAGHL